MRRIVNRFGMFIIVWYRFLSRNCACGLRDHQIYKNVSGVPAIAFYYSRYWAALQNEIAPDGSVYFLCGENSLTE